MIGNIKECPECGNPHFFLHKERGEVICKQCSFVVEDALLDFGKERAFDENMPDQRVDRTGAPLDPRIANNISTDVGTLSDINKLPKKQQFLMRRIRKKNKWTSSALENNINIALTNLKIISSFLKLSPSIEKEAARIYRESAAYGFTRKRSSESTMVAALYAACRIYGVPKTLKEFADASKISKKVLGKTYRMLTRALNLKVDPSNPIDYLGRFSSSLNLSPKTQSRAAKIIERAQKNKLTSGRSPMSIAASALYISALIQKEKKTQKRVTEVTGISEVTLRSRCKELSEKLNLKI